MAPQPLPQLQPHMSSIPHSASLWGKGHHLSKRYLESACVPRASAGLSKETCCCWSCSNEKEEDCGSRLCLQLQHMLPSYALTLAKRDAARTS